MFLSARLRSSQDIRGGNESNSERDGFELEIASRLAEANAYQEHAAFEALIHGPPAYKSLDLETATAMVEKVYLTSSLDPATSCDHAGSGNSRSRAGLDKASLDAVEASAAVMKGVSGPNFAQDALTIGDSPRERDSIVDAGRSFGQLLAAVRELQVVGFGAES